VVVTVVRQLQAQPVQQTQAVVAAAQQVGETLLLTQVAPVVRVLLS
jgi:hypothetical protein